MTGRTTTTAGGTGGAGPVGVGLRFLALVLAIVLAFGTAVMVVFTIDLADAALCSDPAAALEAGECFDQGSAIRIVVVILGGLSGIAGAIATLLALGVALGARVVRKMWIALGAAVVLAALAIGIGSI